LYRDEREDLDKTNRLLGIHVFPPQGIAMANHPRADCNLRELDHLLAQPSTAPVHKKKHQKETKQ
jgi:hypothetical protein